ncbi:hypothetical protein CRYUN_Cryun39dG0060300 [Craigia yunnanensis]
MAPSFDNGSSLFNFVVRDGNGVKGMVDSGISKVPLAYIQPPAEQINKKNASKHEKNARKHEQSPIDLSRLDGPDHDEVVKEIVTAAETLGFFQVVNHGVPVELLESLKEAAHNFFALPPRKEGCLSQRTKEKALEWKDYISIAYTNDAEALQHWPVECREVSPEYINTSNEMVRKLLEVLMGNLGVEPDDSKIDAFIGNKMVNRNFYPTCPNPELTAGVGRNSDMGTLTILLQDGIGGLYVKLPENMDIGKKGEWVEIPPVPGALVINIGDMLQILSNGRYKSAEHRVRTTSSKSRVSIPIFTSPKPTDKIAPLPQVVVKDGVARYREFVFADYMSSFFENAQDGKKSLDFAQINSA